MGINVKLVGVLAAVTLALVPAASEAKPRDCGSNTVPPGQSEVDQYGETVPGRCGNEQVDRSGASGGSGSGGSIPPGTFRDLQGMGGSGQAAAELAQATSPGGGKGTAPDGRGAASGAASLEQSRGSTDDGSFFDGLFDALGGSADDESDGMGI